MAWRTHVAPPISIADLKVRLARDGFDATFPGLARPCPECNGRGRISCNQQPVVGGGTWYRDRPCIACRGSGERE